ncbi:MAG: cation transporter [Bacteroidetes bacterium]|nr:cation transporter [Bacteroidota bacterium]
MKYGILRNTLKTIPVIFITAVFLFGCGKNNSGDTPETKQTNENSMMNSETDKMQNNQNNSMNEQMKNMHESEGYEHVMIELPTMQCGTCKKNIETAVRKIDGIESVNVDKDKKIAHVNFDKNKTDLSKIENAITAAGYDADDKKADPKAYEDLDDCCKLEKDREKK